MQRFSQFKNFIAPKSSLFAPIYGQRFFSTDFNEKERAEEKFYFDKEESKSLLHRLKINI